VMDRRWQLVLDCLDAEQPPFSKGTLFNFRSRLIQADLDRRLVERPWRWRRARPRAGSFGRRWIPVRCGGLAGWRTPTT
jgi:hypothetical protein